MPQTATLEGGTLQRPRPVRPNDSTALTRPAHERNSRPIDLRFD